MRRFIGWLVILAGVGLAVFWFVTRPDRLPSDALAGLSAGDATRGEAVFWAAGCASCHSAPGAEGEAKLLLSGGQKFPSDFGTFLAPNISPDPVQGIGGWGLEDFANAVTRGVSPGGSHYYPAFPYVSYANAELQDIADLKAFMETLPQSDVASLPHEVGFPFNIRRSLGGWKFLFGGKGWVMQEAETPTLQRGRYLVEALGHCGECHTPRNALGGMDRSRWLAGAPIPGSERGRTPNINPAGLDWVESDIAYYLETGFTPDFDSAGGHMAPVVENFGKLTAQDREAVAAYLKAVAPVSGE